MVDYDNNQLLLFSQDGENIYLVKDILLCYVIQHTGVGTPIIILWHAGKTVYTDYKISHSVMAAIL